MTGKRDHDDWEHGVGRAPRWVRLLGWLLIVVLAGAVIAPAVLVLMGRG